MIKIVLNEGTIESEVGQFLSSQRLLNPNKSPRTSRQIGNNDEQMVQHQMPPGADTAASNSQMVHPELHNDKDNQRAVSTVPQEVAANENDVATEPICYFAKERINILETISRTNETKNANVVAAIIRDNLKKCKELGIKKVTFRMDNAGYYRNAALIQTCFQISKEIGIPIARISFSEMQAGKSVADRVGGQAKARIKEANDAGEDIETAKDMYMGLTFGPKPIPALTVAVVEVFDKFSEGEIKIPGISQISDVEYNYDTSSCVVWRHHGIGPGKIIQLANTPLKAKLNIIKTTSFTPETQNYVFWREPGSVVKELLKKKSNASNTQSNVANFQEDSDDECADKVIEEPENISFNPFKIFYYASNEGNQEEKGWALHETEAKKRFSKKVHIFIEEQMAKYKNQGKKLDAKIAENLMETVTFPTTGRKLFAPSERLNSNQIASLVKRKLEKELKISHTNLNEDTRQTIRDEINVDIENETGDINIEFQDHPMFPNDIDLLLGQEYGEDEENQSIETPTRKTNVSKTPENATKKRKSGDSATSERGKRKRKIQK
uniref:Uncharacterized protein n=1 Tax=Panagrolaimus davidi TaxID=227884 RepID=A0A914PYU1_9BILA